MGFPGIPNRETIHVYFGGIATGFGIVIAMLVLRLLFAGHL